MGAVLTLVASGPPLSAGHIAAAMGILDPAGCPAAGAPYWLDRRKAADIGLAARPGQDLVLRLRAALDADGIDVFVTSARSRRKKLVLCDMDSTIITSETLDELGARAGIGERIAAITARAMRGEIDFGSALRERVALLKGLPESALRETLDAVEFSPGALSFVRAMRGAGARCVLVSGGFTVFTGPVAEKAGFDSHHGNTLARGGGVLTGEIEGAVLDRDAKLDFLRRYGADMGLDRDETMAVGDGANDLPMLEAAGLGIGYRPKPLLLERLPNCIVHGDLTAALYAQGYGTLAPAD